MGASKIEWTDATWNPIRARDPKTGRVGWHCVKISPACANCYAAELNRRGRGAFGTRLTYADGSPAIPFLDEETLLAPLRWQRPRKIFVCSMTDLFGEWVNEEWLDRIFAVAALAQQHTFQVLTKRPARMHEYFAHPHRNTIIDALKVGLYCDRRRRRCSEGWRRDLQALPFTTLPLPNVQLGITAEDQPRAEERIPWLLRTPAAVRFVSAEPLLGPIDLKPRPPDQRGCCLIDHRHDGTQGPCQTHGIDWVIVGGESGQHARPMHPDWARSLRDQCQAAGVPFFFKQWGEWGPSDQANHPGKLFQYLDPQTRMSRVGKKAAGRLLDEMEWSDFPQPDPAPSCS